MQQDIPYLRLAKLAIMTAPLFGILGAVPAFEMDIPGHSRIASGFLLLLGISLLYWFMNILLLLLFSRAGFRGTLFLRYGISITLSIIAGMLIFHWYFISKPLPVSTQLPTVVFMVEPLPLRGPRLSMPAIQALSINIIILVLLEMTMLKIRKQQVEHENDRLRLANLEARHNQLKQQLHPHFLFNSLNTLKTLIHKKPEVAEEYLIRLSDLLRFSIYANKEEVVAVNKELELCINYLQMQRVRFGNALDFEITVTEPIRSTGKLPVYSIQLLVENAIKHNSLTTQQPLYIRISGDNIIGRITVRNNLQPRLSVEDGNGVGLSNLAERYRLLGKPGPEIIREDGEFSVTLKVI